MAVMCAVAGWLPDDVAMPSQIRGHRARCLRCQADAVRMRGLLRDLACLRDEVLVAPPGLHAAVMSRLGSAGAAPHRIRTAVTATAGAVVAAAAIAGGLLLRRHRPAG
jgi:hypothetical protein